MYTVVSVLQLTPPTSKKAIKRDLITQAGLGFAKCNDHVTAHRRIILSNVIANQLLRMTFHTTEFAPVNLCVISPGFPNSALAGIVFPKRCSVFWLREVLTAFYMYFVIAIVLGYFGNIIFLFHDKNFDCTKSNGVK